MKFHVSCMSMFFQDSFPPSLIIVSLMFLYSASYFLRRRALYCRIIKVNKVDDHHLLVQRGSSAASAIQVTVRHLSPIGLLLPKTWFDFFMRMNPLAARLAKERPNERPEEVTTELLRVELGAYNVDGMEQRGNMNA